MMVNCDWTWGVDKWSTIDFLIHWTLMHEIIFQCFPSQGGELPVQMRAGKQRQRPSWRRRSGPGRWKNRNLILLSSHSYRDDERLTSFIIFASEIVRWAASEGNEREMFDDNRWPGRAFYMIPCSNSAGQRFLPHPNDAHSAFFRVVVHLHLERGPHPVHHIKENETSTFFLLHLFSMALDRFALDSAKAAR